jgi:hypothetical protein
MQITIATQNEFLRGLAAGCENDDSADFRGCIDASDTGRRKALIILNEYIEKKMKEERAGAAIQTSEVPEPPTMQTRDGQVPQEGRSVQPVQRWNTTSTIVQHPSSPAQNTPRSRFFPFSRSSTLVAEPRPQQTTHLAPGPLQTDEDSLSSARARTKSWGTQASYSSRWTGRRASPPQRQSMSGIETNLQRSPRTTSNITSSNSSPRSPSISESSIGLLAITSYGGCCKYAHYLRDGKFSQSLRRQNLFGAPGALNFNFRCKSVKCTFQLPALKNQKHEWVIDKRPRRRKTLQYTLIFLAKSHVPMLAPLHDQSTKAQYRCMVCVLSHEQATIFEGYEALLEHVLRHAGAQLGAVKLEVPLSFSNAGVSIDADFDVNLPEVQPATAVQISPTRTSDLVVDVELQHELERLEMGSRRSSHASEDTYVSQVTHGSQETDPFANPWSSRNS